MQLGGIRSEYVVQAIRAYLRIAYTDGAQRIYQLMDPHLATLIPIRDLLEEYFRDESHTVGGVCCRRFSLRLGNRRYPNMKLVVQEFMEQGEFFFIVDAHDQLPISPNDPNYEAWKRLRDYNAWIKHRIERRWDYMGLPTLKNVGRAFERVSDEPKIGRGVRILVVDDDDDLGRAVATVLRGLGFTVARAENGMEALRRVDEEPYDLIVMDYLMPDLDGGEVCSRLKADERHKHIPVLLATTTPIELIGRHDADGFLIKPFHRKVFMSLLTHLLGLTQNPTPPPMPRVRA
jgi:CheY-like chemotaxis protein